LKGYVVDASVAVKWLIPEDHSEKAVKLLEDWTGEELELKAPRLLRLEVTNALTKYVEKGILSGEQAAEGLSIFREIALTYIEEDWQLIEDALRASMTENLTVYDAIYLTLAKKLDAALITADERLIQSVKDEIVVENVKDL